LWCYCAYYNNTIVWLYFFLIDYMYFFLLPSDQYLQDTMGHLLGCLKKEKERTAAFQALGLLVVAVRAEIQPFLTKILEIIKAALPPKDFAHK